MLRWSVAAIHLLALGIGLGAVWARRRALLGALDAPGLSRIFTADNWWAVSALLWITTGVARAFGGLDKGTAYYVHNDLFLAKMACFALIFALEIRPIVTLIRWRNAARRGQSVDTRAAPALARISAVQTALVILMVLLATGMARGFGARSG